MQRESDRFKVTFTIGLFKFNSLVSHVFRRFLSQFSPDFYEILQGLFSSHEATTVQFSLKNM